MGGSVQCVAVADHDRTAAPMGPYLPPLGGGVRERDDRYPHVGDKPASLADGGRRQPWTRPLSIRRASPREQTKARPRRPADHAEPAVLPDGRPLQPDP